MALRLRAARRATSVIGMHSVSNSVAQSLREALLLVHHAQQIKRLYTCGRACAEEEQLSGEYSSEMQSKMGTSLTYVHEAGMNYNRITEDIIVGSCPQVASDVDTCALLLAAINAGTRRFNSNDAKHRYALL
jgi:hypothetical protein